MYDQNFSLIFKWVAKYLEKTKIYHFVLDKDVKATIQTHKDNNSKNVIVIGYGNKYSDLADYLKNLAFNIERQSDLPKLLDGKPLCIGRNKEIEEVVNTIFSENKNPIGIIGTVGLEKLICF